VESVGEKADARENPDRVQQQKPAILGIRSPVRWKCGAQERAYPGFVR